ncbi:MAG: hypothetical protein KF888_13045 [Nitrosomonas sp.]|nr:hypothetical protein [Nitrosomonas sp.]
MRSSILFMSTTLALPAFAVDVALRISDWEIIESLAELKAGQKVLEEKMNLRFATVDYRFENVERRLEFIQQLMLVTIAGIFGLVGFVVWDRYSTLRPMDMRLKRLERDLEHDLASVTRRIEAYANDPCLA